MSPLRGGGLTLNMVEYEKSTTTSKVLPFSSREARKKFLFKCAKLLTRTVELGHISILGQVSPIACFAELPYKDIFLELENAS